jgi:peptidoglycan/LPS O-acetylase OafA/YrhL
MTYHVFGWAWLPILFPSIGIMFALAGSLVAGSLDRSPGNPWRVLKKRSIRVLPPVWLFGLVVVPVMLVAGWTSSQTAGAPLSWRTLLLWVLPISDPPASSLGDDWVTPLWYIRSYLWFLLLSPALLWLFRHWPKRMMALPVLVVLLSALGLLPLEGRSGDVILSLAMFGGCWMLGFAHHDNKIRPLPLVKVLLGGASLMTLGLAWAFTHPDPVSAWAMGDIPMADTLYCLGAVLILLRLYPDFSWMDKHVVLDKLITAINTRALTIYLWGNFAIFLANPVLDSWSVTASLDNDNTVGWIQMYLASWVIVIICVLLFGWCEDLAARRPLRINPWPRRSTASLPPGLSPVPSSTPALATSRAPASANRLPAYRGAQLITLVLADRRRMKQAPALAAGLVRRDHLARTPPASSPHLPRLRNRRGHLNADAV